MADRLLPNNLQLTSFGEYSACPPAPKAVIGQLVVERGVSLLVGKAGVGKSILMLNAALSVVHGGLFLGQRCEQGSAIIINP